MGFGVGLRRAGVLEGVSQDGMVFLTGEKPGGVQCTRAFLA
jgi:hypothetical protein